MFIDAAADNCRIVLPTWERVDPSVIDKFAAFPAANVGDAMDRFGLMISSIKLRTPSARCVGSALPVLTREGDNLAVHRALDEAEPGDVLVVNGLGDDRRAVFGDLLAEICLVRGVSGVVVDGAVRDVEAIAQLGLPVWASAVTPAGPTKNGPGVIGGPIACGGIVVHPGDIVVADFDGVAIVSRADCQAVLARLRAIDLSEAAFRSRVHETGSGS